MRYQYSKIRKAAICAFSFLAIIFAAGGANTVSAASVQLAIQGTTASGHTVEANLINVHHRRGRRGPRFSLHIGTPYYYGYYPYYSHRRYCRKIRRKCGWRHGWRSHRWYRCVRYRGC